MKTESHSVSAKSSGTRLHTPVLTIGQLELLERYCRRYHHKPGSGVVLAAMREIRREFGVPDDMDLDDFVDQDEPDLQP